MRFTNGSRSENAAMQFNGAFPANVQSEACPDQPTCPPQLTSQQPTMRILFLINSLVGGGAERVFSGVVNRILPYLPAAEVEVVLLDSETQRYRISAPVKVTCLGSNGSLFDSYRRLKRYMSGNRPDLVISFLTRANYLAIVFSRRFRYRCIISERSNPSASSGSGMMGWARKQSVRTLFPRADHVIAVSEGIKNSLIKDFSLLPQAITVIPNPCDIVEIERQGEQPIDLHSDPRLQHGYIIAVGRLVECKRYDVLIRAYAGRKFTLPLVILGEGPLLGELQQLAQTLGVAERVIFPGFLANPYAAMARASVFVLSSEFEGFPNSLIEAMGLGLPVVSSNCHHGPGEILDESTTPDIHGVHFGKHGVLVPVADVAALSDALAQVLDDTEIRAVLGKKAYARAAEFGVSAAMSRYAAVIQQQLALLTPVTTKE